jgi:polysaccharide pyruvyl transferase WcaK-like protein
MTKALGVHRDIPVVPDLAFSLQSPATRSPRRPGYDVGISPMVYLRPGSWPTADERRYHRLIELWTDIVVAAVARGDRVHLFVSNPSDMPAVRDVWERLDERTRDACRIVEAENPNALLEVFRGLDVIISSRLHGVLLAIVAARPVVALAHERKVAAVMTDAGVPEFCIDLTTATAHQVEDLLRGFEDQLEPCARRLSEYVTAASRSVRKQDELMPQLLKRRR